MKEDALTTLFAPPDAPAWWEYTAPDVDPQWIAWLQAYITHLNRFSNAYRKAQFYYLIIAGRWLRKYHPSIIAPSQWSEALAQDYVTWLCHAERGELVSVDAHLSEQTSRAHTPLQASSLDTRIRTLRRFFKALQRRPYQIAEQPPQRLVLSWEPDEVLTTPENIRRRLAPNPRNIDPSWWQKLTWAAATLSATFIAKLLGHTDLKTLPWYLREDKHQFARAIRKHNPLDRLVMAILDTNALKQGTGEPAVFYYLGYGSDGRPHLCASPDYQTCIHQMRCTECEMHVDAEQAEIIARRPGVLTIEVHIPTPPLVAGLLDQEEELGVEITRHLPAPEVPSPAYHFNKSIPPRGSDPELQQMKKELEALTAEWAEKAGKFDLRSVGMKSLKKLIADLAAKIEEREAS